MDTQELNIDLFGEKNKYDTGRLLVDILEEDFGIDEEEIKKKVRGLKKDNFHLKDIIDLFDIDKEKTEELLKEGQKKIFGDSSKIDWWFNYYNIPLNDRMKIFQLFLKYSTLYFKDNAEAKELFNSFLKDVEKMNYFSIEPTLAEILNKTDSNKTELPYDYFFIETNVFIKDRNYLGFLIFDWEDENNVLHRKEILGFYVTNHTRNQDIDISFAYGFDNLLEDTQIKEIRNFIYSFANFINEREVKVIQRDLNPKNNERRIKNGRNPLPRENIIEITGKLKIYYENLNSESINNSYSSSWVRGHFFHFRNKKFWKGIYCMSNEELDKNNYVKDGDLIRFWKKPCIRGKGTLKKSFYILKDD